MKKLIALLSLFAVIASPVFTIDAACSGGSCALRNQKQCNCSKPCGTNAGDTSHAKCVKCHVCGGITSNGRK